MTGAKVAPEPPLPLLIVAVAVAAGPGKGREGGPGALAALDSVMVLAELTTVMNVLAGMLAPVTSMPATRLAVEARPVTENDPLAVVPVSTTFGGAATVTTGAAV